MYLHKATMQFFSIDIFLLFFVFCWQLSNFQATETTISNNDENEIKILVLSDSFGTHYDFALNIVNLLSRNGYYVDFVVVRYDEKRVLKAPQDSGINGRVKFIEIPYKIDADYERHFDDKSAMDAFIQSQTRWNQRRIRDSGLVTRRFVALLKYNMFSFYKAVLEHKIVNEEDGEEQSMLDWLSARPYDLGIAEFCLSTGPFAFFHRIGLKHFVATSPAPPSPTTMFLLGQMPAADVPERFTATYGDGNNASKIRTKNSRRRKSNIREYQRSIAMYERMYNVDYKALYNLASKRPKEAPVNNEEMPPMGELFRQARYFLVNVHPLARFHVNVSKRIKFIGGIEVEETARLKRMKENEENKLDEEKGHMEENIPIPGGYEWMKEEKCIVVFSMGTMVGFDGFTRAYTQALHNSIVRYPECKFLMRVDKNIAENLRELEQQKHKKEQKPQQQKGNMKIVVLPERIPQKEIMAQPNIRGFIHHCGQNTSNEVLYAGIPFICIPFFGDQFYNAALAEYMGVGIWVEHEKFVQEFPKALDQLLANKMKMSLGEQPKKSSPHQSDPQKSWVKKSFHERSNEIAAFLKSMSQTSNFLRIIAKAIREKSKSHLPSLWPSMAIKNGENDVVSPVKVDERNKIESDFGIILRQFIANQKRQTTQKQQQMQPTNKVSPLNATNSGDTATNLINKALFLGMEAMKEWHQRRQPCHENFAKIPAHLDGDGRWKWEQHSISIQIDGGAQKQFVFREFAPDLFCHLRTISHIDHRQYFDSLANAPLNHFANPSKSTSTFLITADGKFLLKSVLTKHDEHRVLEKHLHEYAAHLTANKNSLLTRFLGLYSVEMVNSNGKSENIQWYIAMRNIHQPSKKPPNEGDNTSPKNIWQFDLKGCYFGRKVPIDDINKIEQESQRAIMTLKDWEFNGPKNEAALFPNGIVLEMDTYKIIAESMAKDATFLGNIFSVLDYSLLISIEFIEKNGGIQAAENDFNTIMAHCIGCGLDNQKIIGTDPNADNENNAAKNGRRSISLRLVIVDLLSQWTWRHHQKMFERCHLKGACLESDQSLVKPNKYAARFKCMINSIVFHVEDENQMNEYESKYCNEYKQLDWNKDVNDWSIANANAVAGDDIALKENENCGDVALSLMDEFKFTPESDFAGSNRVKINKFTSAIDGTQQIEAKVLMAPMKIGTKSQHSSIYVGYLGSRDDEFDAKKCVAIKLTGLQYEANAKNCFRVIKAIHARLNPSKRMRLIDVLEIGRTYQFYVTVMELAIGSFDALYQPLVYSNGLNTPKLIKQTENMIVPLLQLQQVALHQDMKMANYAIVAKENGERVMKLIDFDGSVLLPKSAASSNNPNEQMEPNWKYRVDHFSGPEFRDTQNVKISKKADIWSIGMLIYQMFLMQPSENAFFANADNDDLNTQMDLLASVYRSHSWVEKEPLVIRPDGRRDKFMVPFEFDVGGKWLLNSIKTLRQILKMRRHQPRIFILLTNILQLVPAKRMSAQGVLEYLANNCKPILEYSTIDNLNELVLFGNGITASKILAIIEEYLAKNDGQQQDEENAKKQQQLQLKELKQLILDGNAQMRDNLKRLQSRERICHH